MGNCYTIVQSLFASGAHTPHIQINFARLYNNFPSSELNSKKMCIRDRHIYYLSQTDSGYEIQAEGHSGAKDVCIVSKRPAEDRDIPLSIVSYVERTLEAVILEDGENSRVFGKDIHIKENHCKSVLCMPILSKGCLLYTSPVDFGEEGTVFRSLQLRLGEQEVKVPFRRVEGGYQPAPVRRTQQEILNPAPFFRILRLPKPHCVVVRDLKRPFV